MDAHADLPTSEPLPPGAPGFSLPQAAAWLTVCAVLGSVTAWAAVFIQVYFAPLLLFPLLVGLVLGLAMVGLMRVGEIGHRPTLVAGAILAVLLAAAGQHYLSYRSAVAKGNEDLAQARQFFPELIEEHERRMNERLSPLGYFQGEAEFGRPLVGSYRLTGSAVWASWAVDGLLLAIAAVGLVIVVSRRPYCPRCGRWYRTVRGGEIPIETARRLAQLANTILGARVASAHYRLSNCLGGCGPMRLDLSWEGPDGEPLTCTKWLDAQQREATARALDEKRD